MMKNRVDEMLCKIIGIANSKQKTIYHGNDKWEKWKKELGYDYADQMENMIQCIDLSKLYQKFDCPSNIS